MNQKIIELNQPKPNVYQKILDIMGELDYIQKGEKTVNGQYRFASHDQVTAKIHPLLVKHRLLIIPTVEELKQEGNRTIVKLGVVFKNPDAELDSFTVIHYGYGCDAGDKGPGKALSYAYKYCILKSFALETGEDPDNDANTRFEPAKCLEFDLMIPADMNDKERVRLNEFLQYSCECMGKNIEEVKREALTRMPEFLAAFKNWKPKKKAS